MDDSGLMSFSESAPSSIPVSYRIMQQEDVMLAKQIERTMKPVQPIVYEFTKDKGYLHQYYMLRERVYTEVWDLKGFTAQEDDYDKRGMILVARRGNQVVGGLRLNFRDDRSIRMLPGESPDFEYHKVLPKMGLQNKKIVECTRLAVLAEFRKEGVADELIRLSLKKSEAMNAEYYFYLSPVSQAKVYSKTFRKVGVVHGTYDSVQVPDREEYEGIKMVLSYVELERHLGNATEDRALEVNEA